jgi:hypothetical protein
MDYTTAYSRNPAEINRIETTDDVITGRGGLALFVKYLTSLNIYPLLWSLFGHHRKSRKGNSITDIY